MYRYQGALFLLATDFGFFDTNVIWEELDDVSLLTYADVINRSGVISHCVIMSFDNLIRDPNQTSLSMSTSLHNIIQNRQDKCNSQDNHSRQDKLNILVQHSGSHNSQHNKHNRLSLYNQGICIVIHTALKLIHIPMRRKVSKLHYIYHNRMYSYVIVYIVILLYDCYCDCYAEHTVVLSAADDL